MCGEVLEVGKEVTTLTPGLRVVGLNKIKLGGFAEECVLDEYVSNYIKKKTRP